MTRRLAALQHTPPATGYAYLDAVLDTPGAIVAMAHRGGAGSPEIVGLENSMVTFRHCVSLGYEYLETDVHATCDGTIFVLHDDSLDRTTDSTGRVEELTRSQVERARIGGTERVPRLEELLEEFPTARFNLDLKSPGAVAPLAALIDRTGAHDRVLVGSFSPASLRAFRRLCGDRVPTAASVPEVLGFLALPGGLARLLTSGRVAVLQVPERHRRVPVVTPRLLRHAHAAGAVVHVWTVNERPDMERLLDLGVDGIITDRTDVLKDVLVARGVWRDPR